MPLDPALAAECLRHDMNAEVGFTARPVAGMTLVPVRFVLDDETQRRESLRQFFRDDLLHLHGD
jgi:hypothetical protein